MSRMTQVIVGVIGLAFTGIGLYSVWFGLNKMFSAMAAGNIAAVIGLGIIGYLVGSVIIVILLGVGIGLIAVAIDW